MQFYDEAMEIVASQPNMTVSCERYSIMVDCIVDLVHVCFALQDSEKASVILSKVEI